MDKITANFINHQEILDTLKWADENVDNHTLIDEILTKAATNKGLNHREASLLLISDKKDELFALAQKVKRDFYGNRVVLFAPLYLSNYCVNGCVYCPYKLENKEMPRRKLNQEEIAKEVVALQDMGHKRIVIEAGEHPTENSMDYIVQSIKTIQNTKYKNGSIRRVNVNIAATTVDEYRKLKAAEIGTYILFQETYHKQTYEALHPSGPKADYDWHTTAHDRAMQAGIDDVGIGVLFGLYDYRYEFCALMMHAEHLENTYGVGPHTVSVPRIRNAHDEVSIDDFPHAIDDEMFARIVATVRVTMPYTGIIVSTRETEANRLRGLQLGVSQISGGSKTTVGGYNEGDEEYENTDQFELYDNRTLGEIVEWLVANGYIPSFCTACYRLGRTGDRFMEICKSGQIQNSCHPNALMTMKEYLLDYAASREAIQAANEVIERELPKIPNEQLRATVAEYLNKINNGERDFYV
ncbi:MAG: [FeFe] hydrogenase H-cluster radical SAM maturase HydG [Defluviitaleaceae bacterium]|nr:[FeFe] hydrogenase H-cluster radical SAM maturase HydG [Defluviitaleaceae bacterium]